MFSDRRGFTLGEVLASLIALGIIALTVQSLILVANNFLSQQGSSISSLQEQTFVSKLMCHKFRRPIFVEEDASRSFIYAPGEDSYKKRHEANNRTKKPATLSIPLLEDSQNFPGGLKVDTEHPAVETFLQGSWITKDTTINAGHSNNILRAHINDKAPNFNSIDGAGGSRNYLSLFYDIYADSHTLPTFMVHRTEEDQDLDKKLGTISEGFIYAARCVKNIGGDKVTPNHFIEIEGKYPKYSIIDPSDKSDMTSKEMTATALYVLEQGWRPFYFPRQAEVKNQVLCCDIGSFNTSTPIKFNGSVKPSRCETLEKYTPIVYVMKISSGSNDDYVEDEILEGAGKNVEAYAENEVSSSNSKLESHSDCECPDTSPCSPGEVIKWGPNCKRAAGESYLRKLGKNMVHPVKIENIEELPLVKRDRVNSWAYAFVAPSFKNQDLHKEFKIISIENKCHTSMPIGLCGKVVPGRDLLDPKNKINGKSAADFFIARVRSCPFNYVSMSSSGGPLPLGIDRVQ